MFLRDQSVLTGSGRLGATLLSVAFAMLSGVARAQDSAPTPPAGPPPAAVVVDEARLEQIAQYREVTGQLRATQRSLLAAEQDGLVTAIAFDAGDLVEKGQLVARLDDTLMALALRREESVVESRTGALAERRAELERARRELVRIEELAARSSASAVEQDDRRTAVATWEARVLQAEAELSIGQAMLADAKRRLSKMTIVAPFSGRLVQKKTEVGQWVRIGEPVAEIIRMDLLEARLDVPEALIDRLHEGESIVRIRVPALGREAEGRVERIVPDADLLSRLFPVRVNIANPDGALKPGMTITGLVPIGTMAPMLTVHKDALLRDDAGEFLYFDAGGAAGVARVKRLYSSGDRVAIQPGKIEAGTRVIVEGNERIFPGQPLNIVKAHGSAAPAQ